MELYAFVHKWYSGPATLIGAFTTDQAKNEFEGSSNQTDDMENYSIFKVVAEEN